jgi:hypothetical protein
LSILFTPLYETLSFIDPFYEFGHRKGFFRVGLIQNN